MKRTEDFRLRSAEELGETLLRRVPKHIRFTYQPAANEPSSAGAVILRMEVVSGFVILFR